MSPLGIILLQWQKGCVDLHKLAQACMFRSLDCCLEVTLKTVRLGLSAGALCLMAQSRLVEVQRSPFEGVLFQGAQRPFLFILSYIM